MARRSERGFTLLELVLALSIVAAMLTVLFGGLRVSLRAWQKGDERAEALQHARSLTQLVELSLGGIHPYTGPVGAAKQITLLFDGQAERLSFVTVAPPLPSGPSIAYTAVTLSMETGSSPGLAIREKALPNFDAFESVPPALMDPGITAIKFRYLRDASTWEETWDGAQERALPRAVEVTLTTAVNGRVQEQRPLTVPIRATAP